MGPRRAAISRHTAETQIDLELHLDGAARRNAVTPLPFFNHMLDAFARHGLFDLALQARGDVEVDGHHTVEDVGLALGLAFKAFARALDTATSIDPRVQGVPSTKGSL